MNADPTQHCFLLSWLLSFMKIKLFRIVYVIMLQLVGNTGCSAYCAYFSFGVQYENLTQYNGHPMPESLTF